MSQHVPCVRISIDEGADDSVVDRALECIGEHRDVTAVIHKSRGEFAVCVKQNAPEGVLDEVHSLAVGLPVVEFARVVHAY